MAFPNQINTVTGSGDPQGVWGPFVAPNGAFYCILATAGLQVWKSTDLGVTWAVQDAGASPAIDTNGTYAGTIHGAHIYTVNAQGAAAVVSDFDTDTDTWVSSTVTANDLANYIFAAVLFRESDSTLIIVSVKPSFAVGGKRRTGYFTFDTVGLAAGAWTKNGETGASAVDWFPVAVLAGSGESVFIFLSKDIGGPGGTRAIWQQTISDLNVLGPVVMVDSVTDAGATSLFQNAYGDGSTDTIIWVPTSLSPLNARILIAPATTLAFVAQSVSVPASQVSIDTVAVVNNSTVGLAALLESEDGSGNANFFQNALGSVLLGAISGVGGTVSLMFASFTANPHIVFVFVQGAAPFFGMLGPAPSVLTLTMKGMKVYGGS